MEIADEECKYTPMGSPVEVGMLNWLIENDIAVQDLLVKRERTQPLRTLIPFSSIRKRMVVAYQTSEDTVRIVVKGAPEFVIPMCTQQLDDINDTKEFGEDQHAEYLEGVSATIKTDEFDCLKPLTFGYRDMDLDAFEDLKHENGDFETEESRACLESELTLAATFFLADPLRGGVEEVTRQLYNSDINTRILSGDHKQTVLHVATKIGMTLEGEDSGCMAGEEFAETVKPLIEQRISAEGVKTYVFVSADAKKTFKKTIKS
jgi:P-type Ca2+ transporter type 2C